MHRLLSAPPALCEPSRSTVSVPGTPTVAR
jgi:hypothetical protein